MTSRSALSLAVGSALALLVSACGDSPAPASTAASAKPAAASSKPAAASSSAKGGKKGDPKSTKKKGAGKHAAGEAKEAKQKTGAKAAGKKEAAHKKDGEVDGIACDDALDGLAFCDTDTSLVFCDDKTWFELDCGALGAFCGLDESTLEVDCWEQEVLWVEIVDDHDDDHDDH